MEFQWENSLHELEMFVKHNNLDMVLVSEAQDGAAILIKKKRKIK